MGNAAQFLRAEHVTKYGPQNPHPLSIMRTKLVLKGKYDEFGTRRETPGRGRRSEVSPFDALDGPVPATRAPVLI